MLHQKEYLGKLFLIEKNINEIKWVISNKSKKINGYNCYKATTAININTNNSLKEQEIIAWFAPKINISTGPIGFGGLPGLILELQKGNFIFFADEVVLNPKNHIKITKPNEGLRVSEKEYEVIVKDIIDNKKNMLKN